MADAESFTKKQIEVKITLRAGDFDGKGNTKIIKGLPTKVKIEKTGPPDFNKANIEICGLKYVDIERLTTLSFKPLTTAKNIIEIAAGNEVDGLALAFQGEITSASADFNSTPDIWMKFEATSGYFGEVTPQGPTAINGSQKASTFIESQAKKMGYGFKNKGVDVQVQNSVFNGSPVEQARAAARQIGAELIIDDGTVILSPSGGASEDKKRAIKLTKKTGMLGYPTITNEGVEVKALYNPEFKIGEFVQIESIVPKASGVWRIIKLSHELDAYCGSGGPWESKLVCFLPNEDPPKNSGDKS